MGKWKVQLLGCSIKKWTTKKTKEDDEDSFYECELSVIHDSYKHGQVSFGWEGLKKIIFPDLDCPSLEERKRQFQQATLFCEALNNSNELC